MKVITKIRFRDLKENVIREVNEEFEVNKKRFEEIKKYTNEIKETKKK